MARTIDANHLKRFKFKINIARKFHFVCAIVVCDGGRACATVDFWCRCTPAFVIANIMIILHSIRKYGKLLPRGRPFGRDRRRSLSQPPNVILKTMKYELARLETSIGMPPRSATLRTENDAINAATYANQHSTGKFDG